MGGDIAMEVEHAEDMHPPVAVAQPLVGPHSGSPSPPPELPSYEPDETFAEDEEGDEPVAEGEVAGAEEEESSDSESDESDDESGDEDDAPPPAAAAVPGPLAAPPADAAPPAPDAMAVDVPVPAAPAAAPPLQPVNILVAKPKPKRKARSASRSPPPPAPAPPLQTIRLEFALGGPDNYEVDIAVRAVETGQRAQSPGPPVPIPLPQEEIPPEEPAGAKKRRRRRNLDYDLHDPFIDDSDLAQDQRQYIAQTKQAGFYVSSGEVALLKDRTAISASAPGSKGPGGVNGGPRGKRPAPHLPSPEPFAGPSNFPGSAHAPIHTQLGKTKEQKEKEAKERKEREEKRRESMAVDGANGVNGDVGTRDAPIAIVSDDEGTNGGKRKNMSGGDGSRKRRKVDMDAFHPELKDALAELRAAKDKENWNLKGKFPPGIKPLLTQVALKAIMLNQYDDNFFNYMPDVFPYNRFTMSKLIKRLVFADHMALLIKRQDEILAELKALADENFEKAREEYERALKAWQSRMEKSGLPTDGTAPTSADGTPNPQVTAADAEAANNAGVGSAPPAKRFKLTEKMKGMIWNLVCLSNECCRIENEKSTLEGNPAQVSEQGLRKVLYQKIVAAFPEGWMNSGQISRDVSVIKKKFETAMKEDEV
ncbi:hypothetical protein PENSPDRAFT_733425 [Peniophora sp. CONT]|nr:hypothetical protein PENSPDRAFT_733425 [Peniophora sp. CONT]